MTKNISQDFDLPFSFGYLKPKINEVCFLKYHALKYNNTIVRKGYITSNEIPCDSGVFKFNYFDLDKNEQRCFLKHNFIGYSMQRETFYKKKGMLLKSFLNDTEKSAFVFKVTEHANGEITYKACYNGCKNGLWIICNQCENIEWCKEMLTHCEQTTKNDFKRFLRKIIK